MKTHLIKTNILNKNRKSTISQKCIDFVQFIEASINVTKLSKLYFFSDYTSKSNLFTQKDCAKSSLSAEAG
tara:strand:+ start:877 stop:1089 length:213 start_codon:yes stop_codon:yes gene_type:complete